MVTTSINIVKVICTLCRMKREIGKDNTDNYTGFVKKAKVSRRICIKHSITSRSVCSPTVTVVERTNDTNFKLSVNY